MQHSAPSAAAEWRAHWPLAFAAMIGFSLHPVPTYAIGLFIEPLNREFGWGSAQVTAGMSIAAIAMMLLSPLVGAAVDRWGARRLAVPGTILAAISIAMFGLADGSATQWLLLWTVFAIVSLLTKTTVWTAAISGAFEAGRGVALALTLSGVAIAQILVPPVAYWLIEAHGWRAAFLALGFGWGAVVLVPVALFFFDNRDRARLKARAAGAAPDAPAGPPLTGLSVEEALRSPVLWRIATASFLTMLLGIGIVVHQVPILTEAGVARQNSALLASLAGAAGVVGKFVTGWLMDRRDAGIVGSVTLAIGAVGFALLLQPLRSPALIVVAMLTIGYSTGAKLQISTYLTSRYGGLRNFGKIFGVVASLIAVGSGLGPVLAGLIRDSFGTYVPMLGFGIAGSLVSALLVFRLGDYPDWANRCKRVP